MREKLVDYNQMGLEAPILEKALHLRTAIQSVIGEDLDYMVLGIKSKTITYKRGKRIICDANRDTTREYSKSADNFSAAEFGFFSNLHDLKKPEILEDYVDQFTIVQDEIDKDAKQLLMMRKTVNKLKQIILHKTAIIFRAYTEDEKLEILAKEEQEELAALGFADDKLLKMAAEY